MINTKDEVFIFLILASMFASFASLGFPSFPAATPKLWPVSLKLKNKDYTFLEAKLKVPG